MPVFSKACRVSLLNKHYKIRPNLRGLGRVAEIDHSLAPQNIVKLIQRGRGDCPPEFSFQV